MSAVVSEEPSPSEYFYIDLRRTSNIPDESFKQLCDIVKSVYTVARMAPEEQEKMDEKIRSQENTSLDLPIDGLYKALERFDSVIEDSLTATGICGSWEVARYGKEASVPVFRIYHDGLPVVKSKISPEFHAACSKYIDLEREANISDKTFSQICDVVKSVFMFARMSPDEQKRIQESNQALNR